MSKQIPIYFDSVIVDSPFQGISDSNPNIGRLKVRVFTKYGNRNGYRFYYKQCKSRTKAEKKG